METDGHIFAECCTSKLYNDVILLILCSSESGGTAPLNSVCRKRVEKFSSNNTKFA